MIVVNSGINDSHQDASAEQSQKRIFLNGCDAGFFQAGRSSWCVEEGKTVIGMTA